VTSYLAACCCDDDTGGPACATWASFDFEFSVTASQQKTNFQTNYTYTSNGSVSGSLRGTAFLKTVSGLGNFRTLDSDDVAANFIIDEMSHSGELRLESNSPFADDATIFSELEGEAIRGYATITEGFGLSLYPTIGYPPFLPNVELDSGTYGRRLYVYVKAPHRYRIVSDEIGEIINGVTEEVVPFGADGIFGSVEYRKPLTTLQEIGSEEVPCDSGSPVYSGRAISPTPMENFGASALGLENIDTVLLPHSLSGTIDNRDEEGFGDLLVVNRECSGSCSNVQFYEEDPRP